ncbi:MAG: molybdopterin-binding protein [Firmicutes bacterium]|nr:molybdopterin-binding protein [Bacillota bacterium]MDH7496374.1 molybdopterin-binding protein [Bacillota bacterium]
MKSREVRIEDAVGLTLAYDITEIVPGQRKGAVLRRGHRVLPEDIPTLRRVGKCAVYVLELEKDEVHEDDAARCLASTISGDGTTVEMPGEAWADVRATLKGLLKVDARRLIAVNAIGELLIATRHTNSIVSPGDLVAKVKVRGLVVERERLARAAGVVANDPIIRVVPFRTVSAGVVVTGREVYEGRVKDAFTPLVRDRLAEYGSTVAESVVVPDDADGIARAVLAMIGREVDMVLVTGGMSPDDCTSRAIELAGARVAFYGAPVSPGAMTLLAYHGTTPVVGVPAGILARPRAFFDLLLARLLAGETLSPADVAEYGHGGLCLGCKTCSFPRCPFGRGA